MLLGWAIERELISLPLKEEYAQPIARFKQHGLSPAQLFEIMGGALHKAWFSEIARKFLDAYYDCDYLTDYLATVQQSESDYHVEESQTNISNINRMLDQKFLEFKRNEEQTRKE
jgi:hypothetical protein